MTIFRHATTGLLLGALLFAGPAKGNFESSSVTTMTLDVAGRGKVVIRMRTDAAPETCKRIMALAKEGFYTDQKFFKVIKQPRPFLVQFGDPLTKTKRIDDPAVGTGGSGKKIDFEESGLKHIRGAVGLSRQPDDKNSGDCQFYFMLDAYSFLDGNYTVFGQVVEGLEILDTLQVGDQVTKVTLEETRSRG
jgi:cyclophilin family peptidyl-prolyl cis-trans isomerase